MCPGAATRLGQCKLCSHRRALEATGAQSTSPLLGVNDLQARLDLSRSRLALSNARGGPHEPAKEAESPGAKLLHLPGHDWIKDSFGVLENPENRVFVESKVRGVCGYPCVCICMCHREIVGATSALGHLRASALGIER